MTPSFSPEIVPMSSIPPSQREALHGFANSLRELLDVSSDIAGTPEDIRALSLEVEALTTRLREATHERLPRFQRHSQDVADLLPYSPATGPLNPIAPPVTFRHEDNRLIAEVTFGQIYEGPPNCVHGAVVASLYDQLLAFGNLYNGTAGPTASLTVDYKKPTPLHVPLRFSTWVDRQEGRKVYLEGACHDPEGNLVTACHGLFIHMVAQ